MGIKKINNGYIFEYTVDGDATGQTKIGDF